MMRYWISIFGSYSYTFETIDGKYYQVMNDYQIEDISNYWNRENINMWERNNVIREVSLEKLKEHLHANQS